MSWAACRAVRARPFLTVGISVLLLAATVPFLKRLRLETDLVALLPDDYASVKELKRVLDTSGQGTGDLMVVIDNRDFDAALAYARALGNRLLREPTVRDVVMERRDPFLERHALLYASIDELEDLKDKIRRKIRLEKLKQNPFYFSLDDEERVDLPEDKSQRRERVYYTTEDGHTLLLILKPSGLGGDLAALRDFSGRVLRIAEEEVRPADYHESIDVGVAGPIQSRIDEYASIMRDLKSSAAWAGTLILLVIVVYFRAPFAPLAVLYPLVLGISVAFAIAQVVLGELNMFTAFLFLVLFGLGVDYGVFILSRFLQRRAMGTDPRAALERLSQVTGRSIAVSALTTAGAFATLMITDFKGFSHFGFIASMGILCVLLSYSFVMPSLILVFEKLRLIRIVPAAGLRLRSWPLSYGVLFAGMVLTFLSGMVVPRIKFEYDFSALKSQVKSSSVWRSRMRDVLHGSLTPAVVMTRNLDELRAVERAVQDKIESDDPTPTIKSFKSIFSLLPEDQDRKLGILAEIRHTLDHEPIEILPREDRRRVNDLREKLSVERIGIEDLPDELAGNFRRGGSYLGLIYSDSNRVKLANVKDARRFAEDVRTIPTSKGLFHAASDTIVLSDVFELMLKDGRTAFLSSFLAILVFVLLDLRSVRLASMALVPLIAGMVWMLGVMYIVRIKLNFFNMIVLPSLIGIATDYGVHILHRFLEERSTARTMKQLLGAILVASCTTMFGFGGMIAAHHQGLESIGLLANIGLLCVTVAALFFLPTLIYFVLERRSNQAEELAEELSDGGAV